MPSSVDYYYVKVNAHAIIGGKKFNVNSFEINYELDEIASATICLPIGRKMTGDAVGEVSEAMNVFRNTPPFTPVKLMIELQVPLKRAAPSGKNVGFPDGFFLAFDGYFSAPAHKKSIAGCASLVIQCFGATAALAGATQYVNGTVISPGPPNGSSYIVTHLGEHQYNKTLYDAVRDFCPNISNDLWGAGIQVLMEEAIKSIDIWSQAANPGAASDALNRINPVEGGILPSSQLSLENGGSGTTQFQSEFQKALAKQICDGFYQIWRDGDDEADLWDVLKGLAQHFRFHFVPSIEEDALAPICPNLGGEPWLTIDPSEYSEIDLSSVYSPKFYAYVKTIGLYTKSFSSSQFQATCAPSRTVGQSSLDTDFKGRVKMLEAPCWVVPPSAPAIKSFKPGGETSDKSSPKPNAPPPGLPQGQMEKLWFDSGIGDSLAESILHEEVFRHRKLAFSGRARFDICPGSTVRINTAGENFTSERATFFGMVDRVTIRVTDGPSGNTLSTAIKLANVRTDVENKKYGVDAHPLFKTRWVGGVLARGADRVK